MKMEEITARMANGLTVFIDREGATQDLPWNAHARFQGVYLKHLITGADTEGMLSCHLVRMDPGAVLDDHIHETQWELHEVIAGEGVFTLAAKENRYLPGSVALIPKGTKHKVAAGGNGLFLLAKFFPALI